MLFEGELAENQVKAWFANKRNRSNQKGKHSHVGGTIRRKHTTRVAKQDNNNNNNNNPSKPTIQTTAAVTPSIYLQFPANTSPHNHQSTSTAEVSNTLQNSGLEATSDPAMQLSAPVKSEPNLTESNLKILTLINEPIILLDQEASVPASLKINNE